jgi:hypothetical protein
MRSDFGNAVIGSDVFDSLSQHRHFLSSQRENPLHCALFCASEEKRIEAVTDVVKLSLSANAARGRANARTASKSNLLFIIVYRPPKIWFTQVLEHLPCQTLIFLKPGRLGEPHDCGGGRVGGPHRTRLRRRLHQSGKGPELFLIAGPRTPQQNRQQRGTPASAPLVVVGCIIVQRRRPHEAVEG